MEGETVTLQGALNKVAQSFVKVVLGETNACCCPSVMFRSPYLSVWLIALFDLPTDTPDARKSYTVFRKHLLSQGFTMLNTRSTRGIVPAKTKPRASAAESVKACRPTARFA